MLKGRSYLSSFTTQKIQVFPVKNSSFNIRPRSRGKARLRNFAIASNACQEIQKQIREEGNRRKAVHLSSYDPIRNDEIGLAAAKAGLIDLDAYSRSVDAIRAFLADELHREISDLPYTCPDEGTMTDFLFNLSLELERKYVPNLLEASAVE
jgi:hypothetical protein